jgi:hypothetical protein
VPLEHDIDLVVLVGLLPVGLRSDEHVRAELQSRGAVDDLVAAVLGDEPLAAALDVEWMGRLERLIDLITHRDSTTSNIR